MKALIQDAHTQNMYLIYREFIDILSTELDNNFDIWYPWATKLLIHLIHSRYSSEPHIVTFLRIFAAFTNPRKKNTAKVPGKDLQTLPKKEKAHIYTLLKQELVSTYSGPKEEA
jgi:hypothetical protein